MEQSALAVHHTCKLGVRPFLASPLKLLEVNQWSASPMSPHRNQPVHCRGRDAAAHWV